MNNLETTPITQENEPNKSNGHTTESGGQVNGVSNGYSGDSGSSRHHKSSSSSHKDKHRDRDRDHKKDHKSSRDKDRDKHSSSTKDKEKSSSKDHKSSSSSNRDKDRDRDRDKDKERSDKDKHRSKDRHHDDKKSSSSSKDHKSSSSSSHHHSSSRDKDKDKEHKSSSSSSHHHDKDKHKHSSSSSSKDKERHSSSKGGDSKEHHRSKSSGGGGGGSSSSPSKHHHSSSSSSKDKDRHRDSKSSSSRDNKDRTSSSSKYENGDKKIKVEIKDDIKKEIEINVDKFCEPSDEFEMPSQQQQIMEVDPLDIKNESGYNYSSSAADDMRNMSAASSCDYNLSHFNKSEPNFKEYTQNDNTATSQMLNGGGDDEDDDDRGGGDDGEDDGESNTEDDSQDDVEVKEEGLQETTVVSSGSDDDDLPLASRTTTIITPTKRKMESDEDDDEDIPLVARKKVKKEKKTKKRAVEDDDGDDDEYVEKHKKKKIKKQELDYDDDEEEEKPKKKKQKVKKEVKQEIKQEPRSITTTTGGSPGKKKKKKEEQEPEVWKWWEEEKKDDGTKWKFLEHKGPVFAPPYERLPENVKFYYDGKEIRLSQDAEEVAGFYARMLDHDYTSKDVFNTNFFKDWRKTMTDKEKSKITELKKCNFKPMQAYFLDLSEKNRNRTKEEKEELKQKNADMLEEYGYCLIDGHREKIGNFRIEPPGLFRGRGEHPKMGMLKRRVVPEDVSINCSKDSKIPSPPSGHKWKDVRHDSSVTWLASWTENVQNQVKYVMLNPSSKLKGEKDWQKYETARKLAKSIDKIRKEYREDWKSKEMRIRQRAVALYFIDKLALRAGNEKDEDQADTVGCCSLRVEHISLHEQRDGKEFVVVFDFPGKDSIRYYNEVPVEKRVFKNLQLFMENKAPSDDLFDRLNTAVLNKHLNELMEGLTAKVFRTYNASWTLQQQLDELTNEEDSVTEKILSYNRANRAVAILCNHQRSVPKGHAKSMEKLKEKIEQKREQIHDGEQQVKDAKRAAKGGSVKEQVNYDKKKKMLERFKEQLKRLEVQETDRDENKSIALGTSKLNYLDPRISIAWCKKNDVPIEKIYNKTQRDKFRWAIDMATADYVF